jgi:hypothetical protein
MPALGRMFILLGIVLIVMGGVVLLLGKVPGVGRLPGDILIRRKNFTFYFPLATSLIISILLSLLFRFLRR